MSSNLPPGVTDSMIPGNRPEDIEWEKFHDWIDEFLGGVTPDEAYEIVKYGKSNPRTRSRYPYTFACDYLRTHFQIQSRAEASQKMQEIAAVLGYDDHHEVAVAFAEAFIAEGKA